MGYAKDSAAIVMDLSTVADISDLSPFKSNMETIFYSSVSELPENEDSIYWINPTAGDLISLDSELYGINFAFTQDKDCTLEEFLSLIPITRCRFSTTRMTSKILEISIEAPISPESIEQLTEQKMIIDFLVANTKLSSERSHKERKFEENSAGQVDNKPKAKSTMSRRLSQSRFAAPAKELIKSWQINGGTKGKIANFAIRTAVKLLNG